MNRVAAGWLIVLCVAVRAESADDLAAREQQAFRAAVDRVAPSVLMIETVGGIDRSGEVQFGSGPTTALVVGAEGFLVSSAFNFAQQPASILAVLPDGTRTPARIVARDESRQLVLLKVEVDTPLPVPEAAPEAEIAVGQWALAVGRTFDPAEPNRSVGIVSAVGRIWGKAIQTDAKVSPANYGGPLVDIRGRVLGILVPLSPTARGELAGVEWYDSGIGFAIPWEHVLRVAPRLMAGETLKPGLLGIGLKGQDLHTAEPVIGTVRPTSPAYKAGLRPGDRIVAVDGRPVARQAEVMEQVQRRYAGDAIRLRVARGDDTREHELTLVDHLDPYRRPRLGILPERTDRDGGVVVRHVLPNSPAARAGLVPGDVLRSAGGKPLANRAALAEQVAAWDIAAPLPLVVERSGQPQTLDVALDLDEGRVPETVPLAQPAAPADPAQDGVETVPLKVPGYENDAALWLPRRPERYGRLGLVVWLAAPGADRARTEQAWRGAIETAGWAVLAPQPAEGRWQPDDVEFIRQALADVRQRYPIDAARVVVAGQDLGGALAGLVAWQDREAIRGLAVIQGAPAGAAPDHDPQFPLSVLVVRSDKLPQAARIDAAAERLREAGYPVHEERPGGAARELNAEERELLLRWVETLDRI